MTKQANYIDAIAAEADPDPEQIDDDTYCECGMALNADTSCLRCDDVQFDDK